MHSPRPLPGGAHRLRPIRATDAPAWYACLADPRVHGPTSWAVSSVADIERVLDAVLSGAEGRWRWAIACVSDDRLVGTCGAGRWDDDSAEVAYELAPEAWGRGLATAAVEAFLDEARAGGLRRVEAHTWDGNAASQRVLTRCGFAREAWLPSFRSCRGERRDFWRWGRPVG